MLTLNQINKELSKRNFAERLAKGEGYFYFVGGNCPNWIRTCVWVSRLKDLTLEQWIAERVKLSMTAGMFPKPNNQ